MQKDNYIFQFDGIRLIAIVSVMIAHWLQWQWTNPIMLAVPFVHGVTLFFVLSGFLITRILLNDRILYEQQFKSKTAALKKFYIRRTLRIFPVYYLTLFFLLAINYQNIHAILVWLLTYSTNIYQSIHNEYVGNFNHIWSLCVEEQFYLFWPFVILFTPQKQLLKIIIVAILISIVCRWIGFYYFGKWMMASYAMPCCLDSLGLGALMAWLFVFNPEFCKRLSENKFLFPISILFYVIFVWLTKKLDGTMSLILFDDVAFSMVAFLGIVKASHNQFKNIFSIFLENKTVQYLGKISYGMYLFHLFIPDLFYYLAPKIGLGISNKYTAAVFFFILTAFAAHVSWKVIESPFNKLKARFT